MTVKRETIIDFLDNYLNSTQIEDASLNGLQVEGKESIKKIVFGVSASVELFKKAALKNADMVITHHGLIWDKSFALTGHIKKRVKLLLDNNINLLAYHLPLDKHPKIGNNITLLKYFNVKNIKPFGLYKGHSIGYKAFFKTPKTLKEICGFLNKKLSSKAVSAAFGSKKIKSLAVVTGGCADMVFQAADEKLDLLITGESSEFVWEVCRENNLNFIALGHYNSEKCGILALETLIKKKFPVKTEFVDTKNPF